jgi:hypothetical protein
VGLLTHKVTVASAPGSGGVFKVTVTVEDALVQGGGTLIV